MNFPTGVCNNNVLDVRIERNTVRHVTGDGIGLAAGIGSPNGRAGAVADHNQLTAVVMRNTVEGNTANGIVMGAGDPGLVNANTTEIRVAHNTVCHNVITDIAGAGGGASSIQFPMPNAETGNVLTGEISKNTATTVTVQDGAPGNTADVTQCKKIHVREDLFTRNGKALRARRLPGAAASNGQRLGYEQSSPGA